MTTKKPHVKQSLRALKYSTYGIYTIVPVFLGLTIGLWLDSIFATQPILVVCFLFLGILGSFYNLFVVVIKSVKHDRQQS